MRRCNFIALIGLALSCALAVPSRAEDIKLTVMMFRGGQNVPLYAAQAKGFLAKRGLSVDIKFASSAAELPLGLADGRWQIIHSAADNAVGITNVDKLDAALVIGGDTSFNHIIVQPEIQSLAELRGKTIVLDTANSGFAYLFYAILRTHGLANGDYKVKTVGATPRRLEAMEQDKDNKAAILNPPFAFQAVRAGLKDLGTTVKMMGPYQGTAGYALRSWAKANSDTVIKYLQAYIEGVRWVLDPANKDEATKLLADRLSLSPDLASAVYAVVTDGAEGFATDGRFDLDGFKNVLNLRVEYESGTPVTPERYLDLSYYQRALVGL